MKKITRTLLCLPFFLLASCDSKSSLTASEQTAAMKEEVSKETFVFPTKGSSSLKTKYVETSMAFEVTQSVRFDKNEGSYYLSVESAMPIIGTQKYVYRETESGQYFRETDDGSVMFETKEAFLLAFNTELAGLSLDNDGLRETIVESLSQLNSFANEEEVKNSSGTTMNGKITNFVSINDSSFKLDLESVSTSESSDESSVTVTSNLHYEYSNYLPTKVFGTSTSGSATTTTEAIYTWGEY